MNICNDETRDLSPHEPSRRQRMRELLQVGFVKYPKEVVTETGIERVERDEESKWVTDCGVSQ